MVTCQQVVFRIQKDLKWLQQEYGIHLLQWLVQLLNLLLCRLTCTLDRNQAQVTLLLRVQMHPWESNPTNKGMELFKHITQTFREKTTHLFA